MSLPLRKRELLVQEELHQKTKVGDLEINANAESGEIWIYGFSDFKNISNIFSNLKDWLAEYYKNPQAETNFHFRISCISKTLDSNITNLLIFVKEHDESSDNKFHWHFFSEDDDIKDLGLEYKNLLDIPIQFINEDKDEFNQKELEKINQELTENNLDEAFDMYSKYLQRNYKKWKVPIAKEIYDNIFMYENPVIFTTRHADMFVLSEVKNGSEIREFVIYMIQIIEDTAEFRTNKERFNFYSNARQDTLDEIDELLSESNIKVKTVVVGNGMGKWFKKQNLQEYNSEIFAYYPIKEFDIHKLMPENQLGKVSDDFKSFMITLTSYLSGSSDDISSKVSVNNSFRIMDLAPKSYADFIEGMESIYDKNKNAQDVFSLSFNMAFVSENPNNVLELANHLNDTVFWNDGEAVEVRRHNFCETETESYFKNFLTNSTSNILVIENIEQDLKAEKNLVAGPTKAELVKLLCDYIESTSYNIIILSVTKRGWQDLINQYPLLRVCFQHIFNFKNYSLDLLKKRFITELGSFNLVAEDKAIDLVEDYLGYMKNNLAPNLFNSTISTMLAREVRYYQTLRSGNSDNEKDKVILEEDVHNAIKDEYNVGVKKTLPEIMNKLDMLTGLIKVKQDIKDLAALVKVQDLREGQKEPISLNSIFLGNPGTGKTTVAEILGEIYKNIGVLKKGHIVSVKRHDIVEQYIGYTARNMKELLERARGGVLFIDEAYSLYRPDNDRDFGIEAIDTLVAELENVKDTTCVIMAGYPDKMKEFLDSNPGLASRFPNVTMFNDYSVDELNEIFNNFVTRANYKLDSEVEKLMSGFIGEIVKGKDKFFGNARECRNIFEKLKLIHASRIIYKPNASQRDLNTFIKADAEKLISGYFINNKRKAERKVVGFKNY